MNLIVAMNQPAVGEYKTGIGAGSSAIVKVRAARHAAERIVSGGSSEEVKELIAHAVGARIPCQCGISSIDELGKKQEIQLRENRRIPRLPQNLRIKRETYGQRDADTSPHRLLASDIDCAFALLAVLHLKRNEVPLLQRVTKSGRFDIALVEKDFFSAFCSNESIPL